MVAVAGVVLAGGASRRMGTPKASLEWHGSTLLRRVVGLVGRAVDGPMIVVAASGQALPELPPDAIVRADPREGLGPLQGLAVGLAAAAGIGVPAAVVCPTDVPLLHPAVLRRVVAHLRDGVDVALPVVDGRAEPLLAAYRTSLAPSVETWLAAGERRLGVVADRARAARVTMADLLADPAVRAGDPQLRSLHNVNDSGAYRVARARPAPTVTVDGPAGTHVVRAATVAAAVAAAHASDDDTVAQFDGATVTGGHVSGDVVVQLDGRTVTDGATPLVDGDVVTVGVAGGG